MTQPRFTPLAHSQALHRTRAQRRTEGPDLDQVIEVTVVVRSKTPRDERRKQVRQLASLLPHERPKMDAARFVAEYGANASDLRAVEEFGRNSGLQIVEASAPRRCVVFRGTLGDLDRAFRVVSSVYDVGTYSYRSYENAVEVPVDLLGVVQGVIGLETHPTKPAAVAHVPDHFTERREMMQQYGFPDDADGTGETIGIVALAGGYHESDVRECLHGRELPHVELHGQFNDPASVACIAAYWQVQQEVWAGNDKPDLSGLQGCPSEVPWTLEVTADIQNAALFAPGANLVVYFTPNTMQGKYAAFTTAFVDDHSPTVLSCSSGLPERLVNKNHAYIIDDMFEFAALRGMTICYSSGDGGDGSRAMFGGARNAPVSPQFPATSPHVLACGGTMPHRSSEPARTEVVWSEELGPTFLASGGGVSETFRQPWWQSSAPIEKATGRKGRGVPDVSGKADIETGYRVQVGGIEMPVGGTSTVAPMWAALIARLSQKLGARIGFLNSILYDNRERFEPGTTTIESGSNGAFDAEPGWDPCTGWGTPRGRELYRALSGDSCASDKPRDS